MKEVAWSILQNHENCPTYLKFQVTPHKVRYTGDGIRLETLRSNIVEMLLKKTSNGFKFFVYNSVGNLVKRGRLNKDYLTVEDASDIQPCLYRIVRPYLVNNQTSSQLSVVSSEGDLKKINSNDW